jgi:ABC-type nitrate/sulfonate/bicarbonate transport system substrate-binding protein
MLYAVIVLLLALMAMMEAHAAQAPLKGARSALAKIRVSQSAVNTRSAILWIADGRGLFAKHGIEVETIYLRSSNLQMAALATGEVQISNSGGAPVLSTVAGGKELKIVATPTKQLPYDLVMRPDIKESKDLRGRRFGVTNIGGTTWMAAVLVLEHIGLDKGKDNVDINAIGNQAILAQALEAGNIDATILDPFLSRRLKQKGFRVMELNESNIPFVSTSVVVTSAYVRDHSNIVDRFLKAWLEAQAFIASPHNKNAVVKTLIHHMKLTDPAVAEEGYQDLMVGFERKPYPSVEGLRNVQRMMALMNPKVAKIKPEDIVDSSFIRKLDESGFIDGLYGSSKSK